MITWTVNEFEPGKYSFETYGVRNTILCSLDSYEEIVRISEQLESLLHYKIVAAPFCSSTKLYIADNEGLIKTYEIINE